MRVRLAVVLVVACGSLAFAAGAIGEDGVAVPARVSSQIRARPGCRRRCTRRRYGKLGVEHPKAVKSPGDRLLLRVPDRQRPADRQREPDDRPRGALDRALPGGALLAVLPRVRADVPAGDARRDRPGQTDDDAERGASRSAATSSNAFETYLKKYNHGRGFVLIGHSQGSFVLRSVIAKLVDPKPSVRKRLLSAILMGGNVLVKQRQGDRRRLQAHPRVPLRHASSGA